MQIRIEPLRADHGTEGFSCGNAALDDWFRRTARQHLRKGISRTYVAIDDETGHLLGFYSLTVGEAESGTFPAAAAKGLPRKLPIALLGRLAVSSSMQGRGIGGMLLVDALQRIVGVATQVGIAAILVDAKDRKAAEFYRHHGFEKLPDAPNKLVLLVRTAARLF